MSDAGRAAGHSGPGAGAEVRDLRKEAEKRATGWVRLGPLPIELALARPRGAKAVVLGARAARAASVERPVGRDAVLSTQMAHCNGPSQQEIMYIPPQR